MIVALVVLLLLAAAGVAWFRRGVPRRRSRVVVTTEAGETFDGVVVSAGLVLRLRSVSVSTGGDLVPVDGEVALRWAAIAYVQIP